MTEILDHPSPNWNARRGGVLPDIIVLHYTVLDLASSLARLCDPVIEVSAHYVIAEDGTVLRLVPEEHRAWHAGAGRWGSVTEVNSRSIGIEIVNRGDHPYAAAQMRALEGLLPGIMQRWGVQPERVIAHSDMAPLRKIDPGPRFDWRRLALAGLAVWPAPGDGVPADMSAFRQALATIGYDPDIDDALALKVFRLRFRPWGAGALASGDMAAAQDIAARFPVDRWPDGA